MQMAAARTCRKRQTIVPRHDGLTLTFNHGLFLYFVAGILGLALIGVHFYCLHLQSAAVIDQAAARIAMSHPAEARELLQFHNALQGQGMAYLMWAIAAAGLAAMPFFIIDHNGAQRPRGEQSP